MNRECEKKHSTILISFLVLHRSILLSGFLEISMPELSDSKSREKPPWGVCGTVHRSFYDHKIRRVRDLCCCNTRIYLELPIRRVLGWSCGTVKQEKLAFPADNQFYTKRFASYFGKRCSTFSIKDVESNFAWTARRLRNWKNNICGSNCAGLGCQNKLSIRPVQI